MTAAGVAYLSSAAHESPLAPACGAAERRLVRPRARTSDRSRRPRHRPVGWQRHLQLNRRLLFSDLGRLPKRGDKINVNGYELRVESVRENRIALVRVRERRDAANEQEPTSES